MAPTLILTVDTELSSFPDGQGLWGRVGEDERGLRYMLQVLGELEVRATFFLDVYGKREDHVRDQRRAAELVVARGQDLQLHTHPGPAFDPQRPQLKDYTVAEQEEIVSFGRERLQVWTGVRAVVHRAGDWAANRDTLSALQRQGFEADFSASVWSRSCGLRGVGIGGNGWKRIDGLLCGVGTCYRDRLTGRLRRVDLGGSSFSEVSEMLSRRVDPLILTLHSFSFLRYNRARTVFALAPDYVAALRHFCALAVERHGYRSLSAREAAQAAGALPDASLPWSTLPRSGVTASAVGLVKSVWGRLRS
jgi:hypothetical protein